MTDCTDAPTAKRKRSSYGSLALTGCIFINVCGNATAAPLADTPQGNLPGSNLLPERVVRLANGPISEIHYNGLKAFRITDGHTKAVVVPAIGRVMSYGFANGTNLLWNARAKEYKPDEWKNWGGDKTWPAPQSNWPAMSGKGWPPDPAWDSQPHEARVLLDGRLRMISPVSAVFGARVIRDLWFAKNGDFIVSQTVEKVSGAPVQLSLWSVTQIVAPDAIFMPLNPQSVYKENFHWIEPPAGETPVTHITPTLLQVRPLNSSPYKIGADAPVSAMLAVKDGIAMRLRTNRPEGNYPDGALKHGFPIELWNNQSPLYNELEILSPLQLLKVGSHYTHTVHWSLHSLATKDITKPELRTEVERLLHEPLNPDISPLVPELGPSPQPQPNPQRQTTLAPPNTSQSDTTATDFKLAAPPNPKLASGTLAIVPIQPVKSSAHAVNVAKFARTLFNNKQWKSLTIYVFSDRAAAQTFRDHQAKRNGRPLRITDYRKLATLWPKVPVRYELRGSRETVLYPAQKPRNWWR